MAAAAAAAAAAFTAFTLEAAAGPGAAAAPGFREARDCVRGAPAARFRCHLARFPEEREEEENPNPNLVVLVHGCGCTAASWSATLKCLAAAAAAGGSSAPPVLRRGVTFAAFDMRGHGQTLHGGGGAEECEEEGGGDLNLSMPSLAADALGVTACLAAWVKAEARATGPVSVVLVGHSLGGAVAVRAAERCLALLAGDGEAQHAASAVMRLVGVTVVDVVEGTAIPSLKRLPALLKARPSRFDSVQEAMAWTLSSGMCNNPASAAMSVPAMLRRRPRVGEAAGAAGVAGAEVYTWRTDIEKTAPFWEGWYTGLSAALLGLPSSVGKMLVLASTDRLDTPLTIGHMQGKFQFEVVQSAGHSVHEDQPAEMANLLLRFLSRVVVGVRGLRLK